MKKRGFTLIELLVAMACATIIILTVTGSVYFISKVSNEVIVDSTNNIKIRSVRDYITENKINDDKTLKIMDNKVYHNDKVISDLDSINSITITTKDNMYVCEIIFNSASGEESLTFSYN